MRPKPDNLDIGWIPIPKPGLQTFLHHLCVGYLKRYGFWYTVRRAWLFRFSALMSIDLVTGEDIAYIEAHADEWRKVLEDDDVKWVKWESPLPDASEDD